MSVTSTERRADHCTLCAMGIPGHVGEVARSPDADDPRSTDPVAHYLASRRGETSRMAPSLSLSHPGRR